MSSLSCLPRSGRGCHRRFSARRVAEHPASTSGPVSRFAHCAAVVAVALVVASCGSRSSVSPRATSATHPVQQGPVKVLYAGSLIALMGNHVGPGFTRTTGYQFVGIAGGSTALANEVKGRLRRADVFISASSSADLTLEGAADGAWLSWYASFATAPLVLGLNPHSRFARQMRTTPWYDVITEPGFRLGRTDPNVDPKGALSVKAITEEAGLVHNSALLGLLNDEGDIFPEETLVGRLQAGQLDGGFFYSNEAKAAGIPSVPLGILRLEATYTITVLNGAPDRDGALKFVEFLLGPIGRQLLITSGLSPMVPPESVGSTPPASLGGVFRRP
jgi:molybdate/tungstate transport system substrate-binding protein